MGKTQEAVAAFVERFRRRPPRMSAEDYALKMLARGIDANGNAIVSSVPQEPPIGYKKQPSMIDIVHEAIRSDRLAREAEEAGFETFEESDDFDVGDDDGEQLRSVHELPDAPSPHDLKRMEAMRNSDRIQRRKERFEYWEDRREFQRSAGLEPRKTDGDDAALARRGPGSQSAQSALEEPPRKPPRPAPDDGY